MFCTSCGRSFDVRLCPRLHVNPRGAQVCAQCGSRDLSQPQQRGSWLSRLSSWGLSWLSGAVLMLLSIALFVAFLEEVLTNQQVQGELIGLLMLLAVGWWIYMQIPGPIKRVVQRGLRGRRSNGEKHH